MREYLPILIVGSIIGVFTLIFLTLYAMEKNKKESMGFDRREFIFALNVFEELGLISFADGKLTVYRGVKADLQNSGIYRKVCHLQENE